VADVDADRGQGEGPQPCGPPFCDPAGRWVVTRHRDVRAVLGDRRFEVPAVPPANAGVAWLRGAVSRFANGATHARRRAAADALIARYDVDELFLAARQRTDEGRGAPGAQVDLMPLARRVPLRVLLEASKDVASTDRDEAVECVVEIASVYPPGSDPGAEAAAGSAVTRLLKLMCLEATESSAARIGVLVQACEATAGLIGNSIAIGLRSPVLAAAVGAEALVRETLRFDPPNRDTRRRASVPAAIAGNPIGPGEFVLLDFAAANRDPEVFPGANRFDPMLDGAEVTTFGYGERACPAAQAALALASGVVASVLEGCTGLEEPVVYGPSLSLRVPERLVTGVR
jgi:cytochrome P450